ncbi:MAG: hypothetical protein ABJO57_12970 [Lentilitoribacter sp.]
MKHCEAQFSGLPETVSNVITFTPAPKTDKVASTSIRQIEAILELK